MIEKRRAGPARLDVPVQSLMKLPGKVQRKLAGHDRTAAEIVRIDILGVAYTLPRSGIS